MKIFGYVVFHISFTWQFDDADVLQVFIRDILEHFNGSKEELVIDLLSSLESDFVIFKKNDLYMLL
jgi:hypothetical protein